MDADPTIETRYDEAGLRQLLRDAELLAERVALCVETGDPALAREYAEWTAPLYRRRVRPDGRPHRPVRGPAGGAPERPRAGRDRRRPATRSTRRSTRYRWHRRIAGDARKRNALLQLLYKGG